ncbi:MAG: hypothetical protein FJX92_06785 [Bacteroidetes bacterium]|nr:hypothetical protein [Bacteroidota bacterium]
MAINEIRLKAEQIADWYGQQLVREQSAVDLPTWSVLGDFTKKILILVDQPMQAFLSDEELRFLTGILTACYLNLSEVGIVNLKDTPGQPAQQLHQRFHPSAWWLFGPTPEQLGMTDVITATTTGRFEGAPVFASLTLQQLDQQPEAKKVLWQQLKAHYVL